MKLLLVVSAVIELAAGVALVCCPSAAVELQLGSGLDSAAAVTFGRVTGVALFALGVACWLASNDTRSRAARGVVTALGLYDVGAAVILGVAGTRRPRSGIALWPAVALHVAMAIWCGAGLLRKRPQGEKSSS
jgi:hypothetical protein